MSEVVSLGVHRASAQGDNRLVTPAETLRDMLSDVDGGHIAPSSLVVLSLDRGDDGECYNAGWRASNLSSSEILALIEVAKATILRDMGY